MKKITLLFFFMSVLWSHAQVKDYTFTQKTGTYIPISGGTVLGNATSDAQLFVDPGTPLGGTTTTGPGFLMGPGFTFNFNGVVYDSFAVSNDGWISLGSSTITPNHVDMTVTDKTTPLSSTTTNQAINSYATIAGLAGNLSAQTGSSLMYQLVGTAPNRTLVVQWTKYTKTVVGTGDSFDFQIRLNETTNSIDIVYGTVTSNANNFSCEVGLRAAPNNLLTNFVDRKSNTGWTNTIAGPSVANDYMYLTNVYFPPSGLTYTWAPPVCGSVNNLAVSNITTSAATLTWGSYYPTPSGFEYVVSASSTLPTAAGTPVTGATTNVSGLSQDTLYYVFLRSVCSGQFGQWKQAGTFTTSCSDVDFLFEDFDSYNTSISKMPDCWIGAVLPVATTNASIKLTTGSIAPATSPNLLMMTGSASSSGSGTAYAILPSMTNLADGNHTLKFKAYTATGQPNRTLDVGYYTNSNDPSTFVLIQTVNLNVGAANAVEYPISPAALSGIKNLGFRNAGIVLSGVGNQTTAYIDDIKWEPTPICHDVTAVVANGLTSVSANISWATGGTTAWQYLVAAPSVINPYSLTGVDVPGTNPSVQIASLLPDTKYKVWVRSKCATTLGAWIGPVIFTTACTPIAQFAQNFDNQTTANPLPDCWRQVGNTGVVSITQPSSPLPPSSPNVLKIDGQTNQPTIVALPPLSTAATGDHQLRVRALGSVAGVKLDIGYLTDITDPNTFTTITTITTGTAYTTSDPISLGSGFSSQYLAFRNPAAPTGYVYIDDVVWEPITNCLPVSNLKATAVDSNSATLQWTPGANETQWQYVLGGPTDMDPFTLNVQDMPNPTSFGSSFTAKITGLLSGTTNQIWIRSKCSATSLGSWIGPLNAITTCAPGTEFSQYFDDSTTMPACWSRSGLTGKSVSIAKPFQGVTPPTAPYVLAMETSTTAYPAVVAMPAMSNTAAGTHRLTFKYRSGNGTGAVEVGYLLSIGDPTSFVPLGNSFPCTTSFQLAAVDFGFDPASQILAFRNSTVGACIMEIDNVIWARNPDCADISNLAVTPLNGIEVTDTSINFSWTAGGTETQWEYAVGSATDTKPDVLTHYLVSGTPSTSTANATPALVLSANTTYKIWVRSKCGPAMFGDWADPITATTTCTPIPNFVENFDSSVVPSCWRKVGTQGSVSIAPADTYEPNDGNKLFLYSSSTTDTGVVALPPLSNAGSTDHILKFKFKGALAGTTLQLGYISDVLDPNSFTLIGTYTADSNHISTPVSVSLGLSPVSNILAFRNPGTNKAGVLIDNVSWSSGSTTPPACLTQVAATPDANCGNFATTITWAAVADADGYRIDISKLTNDSYVVLNQDLGGQLSYSFTGDYNTTYYYTVKPYNYFGTAHGCQQLSFVTNANRCYCISAPAANDGNGITNVQLGAVNFANPDVTYNDLTAKSVRFGTGLKNNLQITFATGTSENPVGSPENAMIWIDFNNDYVFDDSEHIYTGVSAIGSPSTLDASFVMPADATLGIHRMRIVTWPGASSAGTSCYNGPFGVTLDFNVNVITAVANDNPDGAFLLTTGTSFETYPLTGTNVNATGSVVEPAPSCGGYKGDDVWYKAVVPGSGNLTFEVNGVSGGLTNTAAAAYSGSIDSLALLACDDSSSLDTNGDQPKINLTGRTAGETIYFRVWDNGGDAFGSFKVSAYGSNLAVNSFDEINFSYYPNPVTDVLNLSFNQEMNNVSVVNLLGQELFSKSLNATQGKIDMSALSKGAYLVKVTVGNQTKTIKVIKE